MEKPLRLCLVSSELTPFAKTGGLGDVVSALVRYLARAGHDVRPFLPLYSSIDRRGHDFTPVSFIRDVPLSLGGWQFTFSAWTAPLPGSKAAGREAPLYFIDCPAFFDRPSLYTSAPDDALRFAFLTRAAIECCQRMGWGPDVFHVHDWHTALLPLYLRTLYAWDQLFAASKTLLTIHNIGYQGIFSKELLGSLDLAGQESFLFQEDLAAGQINFLKTGLLYAGALSTVSQTHAQEIRTDRYGMGLQGVLRARAEVLFGIVNGVDYDEWNPAADALIPHSYSADDLSGKAANKAYLLDAMGLSPEDGVPLVGMVSRLTRQKGLELLPDVLPRLVEERPMRLAVLGSGEEKYEELFTRLARSYPGRVAFYRGYHERLAHLIEAGADLFLMPSLYEPCGLNQMYSQRYGTLPIVRRTGGLADTVEPFNPVTGQGTGFVFEHFTPEGLTWAVNQALDTHADQEVWSRMVERAMRRDFSWDSQIEKYVAVYRALLGGRS